MRYLKIFWDYLKYGKKRNGLFEETDYRDFGASVVLPVTKADLPVKSFKIFNPTFLDQYDSDHCVGFSGAYGSEATEGSVFSGAYSFATSKKVMNRDWKSWGTSILAMCKAKLAYGICAKELWDLERGKRDQYSNYDDIPQEAHDNAANHKAGSFFRVSSQDGMDLYDTLRALLWKYRDKKIVIHTGADAHAITLSGWDKDLGLIGPDTYGTRTFYDGWRRFRRSEINGLFTPYIVLDLERSIAELLVQYDGKVVKTPDSNECYLIKGAKRHHLKNEAIAWAHNVLLFDDVFAISGEEMLEIEEGEAIKFKDGENWQIVQRILEKTNNLSLIDGD